MIRLFNSNETKFVSNGDHVINPFKLIETKKKSLNGWFIEVDCSIEHKDIITKDMLCVIQTKSKLRPQAFRINTLKVTSRKITFTADHVMFDGERYFLDNVRPTNMSAIGALNYIDDRADNDSPFSYTSNVPGSNTAYFIRKNLLEAWSIMEERWQGIFDADNFEITFNIDSPIDKGATLNYGVDLQGVEVIEDWSGVVTKLYPTGYDGIMLPEKFLLSEIKYQQPYTKTVHFESEFEEDEKTPEKLIPELRANARKYMLQNEVPRVSYTVKSDVQQDLDIGDLIVVRHPVLLLNTQVQEYTYDVISKKVKTLVFGNYNRDVRKKFGEVKDLINKTVEKMSVTEALVNHQTNLINSLNKNGFVYIDDNEILILDKLPKENALNVWRFGLGGIGFSSNGYEGPFDFAFTQDGKFNASFISAGSITTNHLASDVGSSLDLSSNEAITALVKDLGTLDNGQNLILGANGELGYKGWQFSQPGLYPPFAPPHIPMIGNTPTFIVDKVHSLSKYALRFFTEGVALSPIAYIVPNDVYSLRLKRQIGMQSFRVSIIELSVDMLQLKRTSVMFDDGNDYEEVTFKPTSETMYARFEIETLDRNSLILTEIMFNRGTPSVWKESSEEVRVYAETIVQILDNKFKIDIEEVERGVDGLTHDIHNAGVEINAKEGITTYGDMFRVMDSKRQRDVLKVVTVEGKEEINMLGSIQSEGGEIAFDSENRQIKIGGSHLKQSTGDGFDLEIKTNTLRVVPAQESVLNTAIFLGDKAFASNLRGMDHTFAFISNIQPVSNTENAVVKNNIGTFDKRYSELYLKNQPNVSSDKRYKTKITHIDDMLLDEFEHLQRKSFETRHDDKYSFGYIAQDVERCLYKYILKVWGYADANEWLSKFKLLSRGESYLSLLYTEVDIIMAEVETRARKRENKELRKQLAAQKELNSELQTKFDALVSTLTGKGVI